MSFNLYVHTNKITNEKYIGITSQKCENRWGVNGNGYKLQPKFYNAIQKYGWENFKHEILYQNLSKEKALDIESQLIQQYDTIKQGYNISPFGNVETKRIICLTTQEIFDNLNDAAQYGGVSPSNLSHYLKGEWDTCGEKNGVKLTWEYVDFLDKNIEAQRLRDQRKNQREKKFYTSESLEIVEKYKKGMSLKQLAKEYGKSRDTIKNLLKFHNITILTSKERRCRKVYQLDNNKNIIATYNSLVEAATAVGMSSSDTGRITRACNEEWRKVKGYYWRWIEN